MKLSLVRSLLAGLALSVSLPVLAASPVWLIEKDGNRLFLGGTFHLLGESDYPLPQGFDGAYRHAEVLVFESDIGAMKQPAFSQQLMQRLSYTGGGSLQQDLSAETYQAVERFFSARGVPMTQINGFKAGMVSIMMTVIELQRLGHAEAGVDEFYFSQAARDNKPRKWLETIDQQIDFLANLGTGQEDAMLRYSMADLERLPELWEGLKSAWIAGDMDRLDQVGGKPLRTEFPNVYRELIVDRNNNWMPQIVRMLESEPVELVLVGALHLAGEQGLLRQLANRGYRLRRLK